MATKRIINPNELMSEIDKVYYDHYAMAYDQTIHDFYNAVRRRIRRCASVDAAEVVHGRWEDVFKGNCAWARYKCSVCGGYALYRHEQDIIGKWETVQALTAYCPYCGAYMEEGEMNGNL